ncbi:MFS transporter [Govanella unica]|uniref:MFS transporter n=1 Tax=Govanella unica TaxID=2975056 RepID=A0A9X3U218_9PROT|nr:MFS transporter [Govania unica]MDA5194994.1 MFS transporter [Govania unica]
MQGDRSRGAGERPQAAKPLFYGWWVVVACIFGAAFSPATLVNVPFSLFITELEGEFGWSRSEISLALTIFIICLVAVLPVLGRVIDYFGVRKTAVVSIFLYASALMSLSFLTSSILHFYLAFAAISILGVGAQSLTYIKVLSAWFNRRRGLVIGICMAGYGIGYILVPILTKFLIDGYGWRMAYMGLGLLALCGPLPIVFFLIRNTPQDMGLTVDGDAHNPTANAILQDGKTFAEAMRTREFWVLAATFILVSFSLNGIQSQIVPLLQGKGLSADHAMLMLAAIGVGSFPGRVLAGYLMDKIFAPYVIMVFYALSIVGILFLISGGPTFVIFLCAVAVGLSLGAENDALGYLTGRYFGLKSFGQIYSVLLGSYLLGAAAGPYFMARAYDNVGSYDQVLAVGIGAVVLSCLLLFFLRPYQRA